MHWSVVEFEEDWLISSDQPVVLLPPGTAPYIAGVGDSAAWVYEYA